MRADYIKLWDIKNRNNTVSNTYDYSAVGAYFVTICVKNRGRFMINGRLVVNHQPSIDDVHVLSPVGEIVAKVLTELPIKFPQVTLDEWVIMPDHVHLIVIIHESIPLKYIKLQLILIGKQDSMIV